MALKKTPPRIKRLQLAKIWISTYTGENIVKGYKKHFALTPLGAIKDLQLLGYEFTEEYVQQVKISEINKSKKKKVEDDSDDIVEDNDIDFEGYCHSDISSKIKRFKNHQLIDGRLLQTNKKFSQLKERQKNLIGEWFYEECLEFFKQTKRFPSSKNEKEVILDVVYQKIEEGNIWIPFIEIKQYFSKKQTKLRNRITLKFNGEITESF